PRLTESQYGVLWQALRRPPGLHAVLVEGTRRVEGQGGAAQGPKACGKGEGSPGHVDISIESTPRTEPRRRGRPEVASICRGTMNGGRFPGARRGRRSDDARPPERAPGDGRLRG